MEPLCSTNQSYMLSWKADFFFYPRIRHLRYVNSVLIVPLLSMNKDSARSQEIQPWACQVDWVVGQKIVLRIKSGSCFLYYNRCLLYSFSDAFNVENLSVLTKNAQSSDESLCRFMVLRPPHPPHLGGLVLMWDCESPWEVLGCMSGVRWVWCVHKVSILIISLYP